MAAGIDRAVSFLVSLVLLSLIPQVHISVVIQSVLPSKEAMAVLWVQTTKESCAEPRLHHTSHGATSHGATVLGGVISSVPKCHVGPVCTVFDVFF